MKVCPRCDLLVRETPAGRPAAHNSSPGVPCRKAERCMGSRRPMPQVSLCIVTGRPLVRCPGCGSMQVRTDAGMVPNHPARPRV